MPTINDYNKKALNDAGYSGDISTAEWKWLKAICSPYVGAIPDMWRYALRQVGFTGNDLPDMQNKMFASLGLTGAFPNKWYKYWRDTPLDGVSWWGLGSALDLDFANSRGFNSIDRTKTTPDSILTYTAPSPKLVYGSDGVLRYAPHNLLLQSQTFETASWTKTRATVTANAVAAPDGTVTAATLSEDGTAETTHIATQSFSYTGGTTYTFSIFVKKANRDWFVYQLPSAAFAGTSPQRTVSFNLNTGAVGTSGASFTSSSIQSVGNGWYRCIATAAASATASSLFQIIIGEADGDFTFDGLSQASLYIWGAQISQGVTLFTYIPTTTAAVYSLPIDHNPTTFAPLGVLIEEQRVNLLLRSQDFSASWILLRLTLSTKIAAPDGTTTADLLLDTAVAGTHVAIQTISKAASSIVYNSSVYVKANVRDIVEFRVSDQTGNGVRAVFNLTTGLRTTAATAYGAGFTAGSSSITSVGNGWYRIELGATSNTATVIGQEIYVADASGNISYTGNGSGLYVWGAQLEAGAFPTSYIPTVASQSTRAADQVSILTSAFGYNAAEGTMAVEGVVQGANAVDNRLFVIGNVSASERSIDISRTTSTSRIGSTTVVGAATISNCVPTNTNTISQPMKIAGVYKQDDFAACLDGGAVATDTSGAVPAPGAATDLYLGRFPTNIRYLNGHIKRLTYFPTRRSNADLQVLST